MLRELARHKTAITRHDLSRPIRRAIEDGILEPGMFVFDYGCGKGSDVRLLRRAGYEAVGWDPYYAPQESMMRADVVNLGYVVNVIEHAAERRDALRLACSLARRVLVVAAQTVDDSRGATRSRSTSGRMSFGDSSRRRCGEMPWPVTVLDCSDRFAHEAVFPVQAQVLNPGTILIRQRLPQLLS